MAECNKCIFSKCCKDNGKNPEYCWYFEDKDDEALFVERMRKSGLLGKDEELSDAKIEEALRFQQELRVEIARDKLKEFVRGATFIILFATTILAFICNDSQWSKVYLQVLAVVCGTCLAVLALKGICSLLVYLYENLKIVIRGR